MTLMLAQSPPKRGDALHFKRTLENIVRVRPRYPIDTWTTEDAAEFWLPGYDYSKANPLSADMIVALAARFAARCLYNHPKFHHFIVSYKKKPPVLTAENIYNPPINAVLRRMYTVSQWNAEHYHPIPPTAYNPNFGDCSYRLRPGSQRYCDRTSCKNQSSFLNGCVDETTFNTLKECGQLVPWSSVNWGGLACWFTIIRSSLDTPYISVQRSRSHVVEKVITRDLANCIRDFQDLMPKQLLMLNEALANDARLREDFMGHVEALEGERLRFYGMVIHKPNCEQLMKRWDDTFAASCWMFGKRDEVYADFSESYWDLEWDQFSAISQNQMSFLFPVVPEPPTT